MIIANWADLLLVSLKSVWLQLLSFLPNLAGAVVMLVLGLLVAVVVERLVERLVHHAKLDMLLQKLKVNEYLHQANLQLNSGDFLGKVAYWLVLLSFVLTASDILGFDALSVFISDVLFYIPNIVVAFLIMIATLIVAKFMRGLVTASVLGVKLSSGKFLGLVAWWTVFVFGALTALSQLGVATTIVNGVVVSFLIMLSLAGGLAFGLGGKDEASRLLSRLREDWGK